MIEKECDFRAEEKYHLIEAYAEMMLDRISPKVEERKPLKRILVCEFINAVEQMQEIERQ